MMQRDTNDQADAGLTSRSVIGTRIDATSYQDAITRIVAWAAASESRYVCFANVHVVMQAHDDSSFRSVVADADLVTPDGIPIVWALRLLRVPQATQCCGPELMPMLFSAAASRGINIGFYGGSDETLDRLLTKVRIQWPRANIAYAFSPPFRTLTDQEDEIEIKRITDSGVRILFVGLGCPKQERWAAAHKGRLPVVMLGVGAAFDFLAGTKPVAPALMRRVGLEWIFRFVTEPKRLWRRYLYHNPRFLVRLAFQVLQQRVL